MLDRALDNAWREAVAKGLVAVEFGAPADDPDGQWRKGERLRIGVKLGSGGEPGYDGLNVTTGAALQPKRLVDDKTGQPLVDQDTGRPLEYRRSFKVDGLPFQCELNGYRALRPGGGTLKPGRQPDLPPEPLKCGFACQDPTKDLSILRRPVLLKVRLKNAQWAALHNMAPLEAAGHVLWFPVSERGETVCFPHAPQRLSREFLEDLVELFARCPGYVLFFNSPHAGATQDHIHAQMVRQTARLAIEDAAQVDCGCHGFRRLDGYPARGFVFLKDADAALIYSCVDRLQQQQTPYNLIMAADRIVVVPRDAAHEVVAEFPKGVLASMEFAGKIITTDKQTHRDADAEKVKSAFGKTTLALESVLKGWRGAERRGE